VSKSSAGLVALFVALSVTLAAFLGRTSNAVAVPTADRAVAVPTADRAVALAEAWLAPRLEGVAVERGRATLVESADEFGAVTTFGPGALGLNSWRPVWVVTLGAKWPGQTNRRALRYVIEAATGSFLVESMPRPGSPMPLRSTNLTSS
jgi:hypothetical protein